MTILNGVSLSINAGETVAVVGVSGSGKSTLLGMLAGLDLPTAGRVYLNGVELTGTDEDQRARLRAQHVGFVFQNFQLLPGLNAVENVMLPLELAGHKDAEQDAIAGLVRVGLDKRTRHYPAQLSGGEQQRVAIARAFAAGSGILFADEPTGNLDELTGKRVIDLLFELNRERGTTLVMVTHDAEIGARCGRRLELSAGRLVATAQ